MPEATPQTYPSKYTRMLFRNTHAARQSGEKYYRGTDYVSLVRNVTIEGLVTSYATQWDNTASDTTRSSWSIDSV